MPSRADAALQPAPIEQADDAPIAIGITGHRLGRIAGYDLAALARRIDETLATLEKVSGGARFRLVGSLAEGADTIVAEVALDRGWQVDAVLPFERAEYARDFVEPKATDRLAGLIVRAKNVFELPGSRHEAGGEAAAYERAGRVMLSQSELLIAVWDGGPPQGRGGAAQMVVEAIGLGMPIVSIHPDAERAPELMWSGLNDHQLGPEALDTVARSGLDQVSRLFADDGPLRRFDASVAAERKRSRTPRILGIAYPLLLAATGVRPLRWSDFRAPRPAALAVPPGHQPAFKDRVHERLIPQFEQADLEAGDAGQLFRGAFVSNFSLAALAVTLSLLGLVIPKYLKPLLVFGEFTAIATILLITQIGGRVGWHRQWLERRQLAERLRCLAISAELGNLSLVDLGRNSGRASSAALFVARGLQLPSASVTPAYLGAARDHLLALLDDQISYLRREATRMHHLEHRLHRVGGVLFAMTAVICAIVLAGDLIRPLLFAHAAPHITHPVMITVISAALPAIGAAIYGMRMQGDFAGVAERNTDLAAQLVGVRLIALDEAPDFDGLRRLVRRTTELLTEDVSQWLRASLARPLSLPG